MVYVFYFMFCEIKKFNFYYFYFIHGICLLFMRLCVC